MAAHASFEPIAIVGRACLLPGANGPEGLWDAVVGGRDLISRAPAGYWRVDPKLVLSAPGHGVDDRTWSDRGGYVRDFDAHFDATGFALDPERIAALDPLFQWTLHVCREALRDARQEPLLGGGAPALAARTALILGNLSYPTQSLSRYAEAVWLAEQHDPFYRERAATLAGIVRPSADNRFMSGLPALLTAKALGLGGGAFCLDAACASSLYAIALACRRLQRRDVDLALAGGINRADDLFIHVGFSALQALSKTGQSRPFHRDADGLVPAEGAAVVALRRLDDALAADERILGIVRGVGLSNDGAGKGLLVPSADGQERALRRAFSQSGLAPQTIDLLEAHATGTPVGDGIEVESTRRVYGEGERRAPLALGSLKSNIGHSITVSGAAGLLKVLGALEHQMLPPTLHVDATLAALEGTPLALVREARPWPAPEDDAPRRAAISSFGFGGNNGHLLVESAEHATRLSSSNAQISVPSRLHQREPIAIVDVEALVGSGQSTVDFAAALFGKEACGAVASDVILPLTGLRFPPADLDQTLAQQLMLLRAGLALLQRHPTLPREKIGVLIGMQCDAEVARYGARWRLEGWAQKWAAALDIELEAAWLADAREQVGALRRAAGVIGAMPNIPANRLCSQLDLRGPSFTVSAEEASGLVALELACDALAQGEIDAALVGAVDLGAEPVQRAAVAELLGDSAEAGDAALLLLLEPLAAARSAGHPVLAVISFEEPVDAVPSLQLTYDNQAPLLGGRFGHAHAATGLLQVAAAALACAHRARLPDVAGERVLPLLEAAPVVETRTCVLEGEPRQVWLQAAAPPRPLWTASRLEALREEARPRHDPSEGGELAFVYTGPAGAYAGMGAELLLAFPWLLEDLDGDTRRCLAEAGGWIMSPERQAQRGPEAASAEEKLWGSALLSDLHTRICREVLGLRPTAALGLSAGESNALFGLGAWNDMAAMYAELREAKLYSHALAGACEVPRAAWRALGLLDEGEAAAARWRTWRILAPLDEVRAALSAEPLAHLTIIQSASDVTVAGEAGACQRVAERVGMGRSLPLGYDFAIHAPEVEGYLETWYRLHHRETTKVEGVRFYSAGFLEAYTATAERAAEAICAMATRAIDWPALVERAYADGVRTFLEIGPRDGCSRWIGSILGDRPHTAVALDRAGQHPLTQLAALVRGLTTAGVDVDLDRYEQAIERARAGCHWPTLRIDGPTRTYPAHPAPLCLPSLVEAPTPTPDVTYLPQAPALPSVRANQQVAARAVSAPPLAAVQHNPILSALLQQHAQLGAAHRAYLAEQARAEQAFLRVRQAAGAPLAVAPTSSPTPMLGPALVADRRSAEMTTPSNAAPVIVPSAVWQRGPSGPRFDRAQLEVLASEKVSEVFGELFAVQDDFPRQVRLPEPPLLLTDRVTGLDAPAGSMTKGTIWTETDVRWDSWYLNRDEMPAGIMVEAGQSDLLLISWLGADFLNRGERVYRLLGCELSYRGGLPRPGDTLVYDIHVDGHAQAGATRLFFFHYDCRVNGEVRLSVRNGQAGFFTDAELAGSGGVLWSPEAVQGELAPDARVDAPRQASTRRSFSAKQVQAFSEGRVYDCFGKGFERTLAHTRTPKIQAGRMLLLDEVEDFDPRGGPWGRGYLRVRNRLSPDDWYLQGHFKNDPCMPGTLMCEGCLQAMVFFLTGCGHTLERDGWRFEPLPDETYHLRCRGQVTPSSRELVYEVFVEELHDGPTPTIIADILGSADGLKIFHGKRMALRLVPDWPLTSRPELLAEVDSSEAVHEIAELDGFRFGYRSLLSCAWGRPSEAFGELGAAFDGTRHIARLPGPPYHFMSRVTRLTGPDGADPLMGAMQVGTSVELEYDIPKDAWYFEESNDKSMPFCVLLEAALQPCGWLAVFSGGPARSEADVFFRNLDGTGTIHRELTPDSGTLRTRTKLTSVSRVGPMTLVSFELSCTLADGSPVYELQTGFGFFPKEALAQQVGIAATDEERAWLHAPVDFEVDLTTAPERYCEGTPRLPGPMLRMIDRVTGYWPAAEDRPARLRSEKKVDPSEWFFRSHFYQDPVQPGSLGIEAMIQLLQFYMLHEGLAAGIDAPRFEPLSLDRPMTWKYRGQVTPEKGVIRVEMTILEQGHDDDGAAYATAEAWLWVDDLRIYQAKDLTVRIVSGAAQANAAIAALPERRGEERFDPIEQPWALDHRPNYTRPSLPLMTLVDRAAGAALAHVDARYGQPGAEEWHVVEVGELALSGWAIADRPFTLESLVTPSRAMAEANAIDRVSLRVELSLRYDDDSESQPLCKGTVVCARSLAAPPAPWPRARDAEPAPNPYQSGALFHGPALQLLRELRDGPQGSSALLDAAGAPTVPRDTLHPALLDGALHGIPHDDLSSWAGDAIDAERLGYPLRLERARFFSAPPTEGPVRVEARLLGVEAAGHLARFALQLIVPDERPLSPKLAERVFAELELLEALVPMGEQGRDREARLTFLRDRDFIAGIGLSEFYELETRLTQAEVRKKDWLPGSVAHAYGLDAQDTKLDTATLTREVALRDHVAQRAALHPSALDLEVVQQGDDGWRVLRSPRLPLSRFAVTIEERPEDVRVRDAGTPVLLDLTPVLERGRERLGLPGWVGEEVTAALCQRFVRRVVLEDPAAFSALVGRPALYLGNHQVQVESILFSLLASALSQTHVVTIAKAPHEQGWVGQLVRLLYSHPGIKQPDNIVYFDQQDRESMFGILERLRREVREQGHSVFLHPEGELSLRGRRPVQRLSSVFVDLAVELDLPIVPVRFVGGLPVDPLNHTLDFPWRYGQQDYWLGRPLDPATIAALPYAERRTHVLAAINSVGPLLAREEPLATPQGNFAERVAARRSRSRGSEASAVISCALEDAAPSAKARRALDGQVVQQSTLREERWLAELSAWLRG